MELYGRRYDTAEPVRVDTEHGRVVRLTAIEGWGQTGCPPEQWPWLAPGLIDLQVNGYGGQEFSSAELTPQKVASIVRAFEPFGVTRLCPTLTTERFSVLEHALKAIAGACEDSPELARRIPGIHLEGPYITAEEGARGAHPKEHCRRPDWDEFQRLQEAAGGRIRIVTLSAEFEESIPFIRRAVHSGLIVAIGHTAATPDQIRAAADAGARMSTHLGNGSHLLLPRLHNYLWAQLAEDRLMAGLICDGHHLPPEVVKVFVRAKTAERCILVSDISGQAGRPPGRYESPFCNVEILPDGRLVVAGQTDLMAGASVPLSAGVANVMRFATVDLPTAIRMAVDHPAALLGVEPGGLDVGQRADLVQFELAQPAQSGNGPLQGGLRVVCCLVDGQPVWGSPWRPSLVGASV
ncbi:MAG: N-acetylglucosamine-6-phosphate deacetylase [Thermoguttaceae bacterium]